MLLSAAIGFCIGVVVTLAFAPLAPVGTGPAATTTPAPLPTPIGITPQAVKIQVTKLANGILQFTCLGQPRVEVVSVTPVARPHPLVQPWTPLDNITIVFKLNSNYFGSSTQVHSAKVDVFNLLKTLYIHSLPISAVNLIGKFHFPNNHSETIVLKASIDPQIASSIRWRKWNRTDANRLWQLLRSHWISPQFANYKGRCRA
jgi:hypothetical protein